MNTFYIDVREVDEFEQEHIKGSLNTPLSSLDSFISVIKQIAQSFKVILVCKSGVRSSNALNQLKKELKEQAEIEVLEGGIDKWNAEGKELISKSKNTSISIIRQVMIVAGCLILFGSLGALYLNSGLIWLSVFVGAGLSFAGLSGICFMAKVLAKMPWNS